MANYSSWKVNELKAELKRRGIPQTGLRLKQHFIDRLLEDDANQQPGDALEEPSQKPDTAKDGDQTERDQHAKQLTPLEPSQSQEPKPDTNEVQEKKEEEGGSEAQHDAIAQKRGERKTGEGVEEQEVKKVGEQQSQAQQVELVKEPEPQAVRGETALTDAVDQTARETSPQAKAEKEAPAGPVEQAPGYTTTQEPAPAAPDGADVTALSEKIAPPAQSTSEVNTELSTPVPAEEAIEDSRKRKRRSKSPTPTPDAIANKKVRSRGGSPRILLAEDAGAEVTPQEKDVGREPREALEKDSHHPSISEDSRARKGAPSKQGARFKDLLAPAGQEPVRPASPPRDVAIEDVEVEPAQHNTTAALYVDGLMRPLQPAALKSHLISLASAPGTSPNRDVVVDFYLDPIKTHCFVSFANVSAASRARSALHGAVWPNERNRKALFVDFIPEHKMQEWIDTEDRSRGQGWPAPRWGVMYNPTDHGVEAVLQEVDAKAAQAPPREPAASRAPPLGPRASFPQSDRRPSGARAADSHSQPGHGFQPLDDLFQSTRAKPKLYYLPVSRAVADRRLDRFDDLIRKGSHPRRGGNETRRISFEEGDLFVDQGGEFGSGGGRGGRGRGRGFGRREGWRGRY